MTRPAVAGLNHVTLAVASLDRALAFYVDLLGCRLRVRWDGGAYLTAGELWLCLSIDTPQPSTDYTHVALTIDANDLDTWRERLEDSQVAIWKDDRSEGASIYCLDPDGHKLELHAGDLGTRLSALQARPYAGLRRSDDIEPPFASADADAVRLLLVAGSVRAASVNRAFVWAIAEHVPTGMSCERFEDFDRLPPFSPDRDRSDVTPLTASGENELALADWLGKVRTADVVLLACPEYAGGLPGTVKNGLDHLVGSDAFIDKPFVRVNLAPRAHRAQAQLSGVLTTMSGRPVRDAFMTLDVGSDASSVADRLSAAGSSLAQSFAAIRATVGRVDATRATGTGTR